MAYMLKENIALRSWKNLKYAVVVKGTDSAFSVGKKVFDQLVRCDGTSDYEPENVKLLKAWDYIEECESGKVLNEWQKLRTYDNVYMPLLNLAITDKCNFNCLHCFNAIDNMPICAELSYEQIDSILKQAADCGIMALSITGGEPMLHPRFMDIIKLVYSYGMHVYEMYTNGWFITEDKLKQIKELDPNFRFKISFDGVGFHDWMRNKEGAEENALKALRLCVEHGFKTTAHLTVNRKNKGCVRETLELMESIGVTALKIIPTIKSPRWEENAHGQTMDHEEYLDFALDLASEYIKKPRKINLKFWGFLELRSANKSYHLRCAHDPMKYSEKLPLCSYAKSRVAIASNGALYPCLQLSGWLDARNIKMGNVLKTPLRELLTSGEYLDFLNQNVGDKIRANGVCGECKYLKICQTGCPADSAANMGDILAPDPLKCAVFKGGYQERVKQLMPEEWKNTGCENRNCG